MGYHNLYTVEEMVKSQLLLHPKTRASDELLTLYIYHKFFGISGQSFDYVLLNRKKLGLPNIETIGRTRRKLQEKEPQKYGADETTKALRKEAEKEFYEYAKGE